MFTMTHAVDIPFQLLVCIDRHMTRKVLIFLDMRKHIFAAVFRILGFADQILQHFPLEDWSLVDMSLQLLLSGLECFAYNSC